MTTTNGLHTRAEIIKIMGHPERLRILKLLLDEEKCVKDICESLNLPQPKVSQHIGIMKEVGIIDFKREGTRTIYRIKDGLTISILKIIFNRKDL